MSGRWLAEATLTEELGAPDALALLSALGGMSFYVPLMERPTDILGRDLSQVLSASGYRKLIALAGGETVCLPNVRRGTGANEARKLLRRGLSARQVADTLHLSLRYVEYIAAAERARPLQLSLLP